MNQKDVSYNDNYILIGSWLNILAWDVLLAVFMSMMIEFPMAAVWKVGIEMPFLKGFKDKPPGEKKWI